MRTSGSCGVERSREYPEVSNQQDISKMGVLRDCLKDMRHVSRLGDMCAGDGNRFLTVQWMKIPALHLCTFSHPFK